MEFGYCEGDVCNRPVQDGRCTGVIELKPVENCSCHISPPCSACVDQEHICSECEYSSTDDIRENQYIVNAPKDRVEWRCWEKRPLDPTKIDWHWAPHTHFTMIKEGVYPEGATRAEVDDVVRGTFGGRFESFGGGKFKYIAYTD